MRGTILSYDENSGLISGHDGSRYKFVRMDWSGQGDPTVGQEVDFTQEGDQAKTIFALSPPPAKYNKTVLALVCFFMGVFGIHRFIVGKRNSGIAMLAITFSFFGGAFLSGIWALTGSVTAMLVLSITSFCIVVSGIWALVDFVKILTGNFSDKDGNKITSWN